MKTKMDRGRVKKWKKGTETPGVTFCHEKKNREPFGKRSVSTPVLVA